MKLSHKIRKLADPAVAVSFKRAVARAVRPLPVSRFMSQIDEAELKRIRQTYGVPGSRDFPKYVEAERFLKLNIRRAQDLGLDRIPAQRILDLGSGAGYFLFVTRVLGHSGLGIDLDNYPTAFTRVPRQNREVEAMRASKVAPVTRIERPPQANLRIGRLSSLRNSARSRKLARDMIGSPRSPSGFPALCSRSRGESPSGTTFSKTQNSTCVQVAGSFWT